jgi:hypothetical protein
MENPARNERHATQQAGKKQRRKPTEFKILTARNDASERGDYFPFSMSHFPFLICLTSCFSPYLTWWDMENERWKMENDPGFSKK